MLGWLLAMLLLLSFATRAAGLKYVQGVIWPSDLNTFRHLPTDVPIDVAILGSSRASFDLPPSALDRCLGEKLGRPTRTVNLARAYANSSTLRSIAADLLVGPRTPKLVLLALEAESLDAHNPQNASYVAYQAGDRGHPGLARPRGHARPVLRVVPTARPGNGESRAPALGPRRTRRRGSAG